MSLKTMTISKYRGIFIVAALIMSAAVGTAGRAHAQELGLRTNLLSLATGTVNFGAEWAFDPRMTVELIATCNIPGLIYYGDKARNRKLWNWMLQPEVRFWQTEAFNRGFFGIHAGGGAFDAGGITLPLGIAPGLARHRFEGWMAGAGVSYGWQWWLDERWNLEATFGFGYFYMKYNRFTTPASTVIDRAGEVHHYFGPSRLGISVTYLLGSKKQLVP
jgi:hypothetical protein